MKRNGIALIAVLLVLVALPAGLFGYQATRTQAGGIRVIEITARAPSPDSSGFTPDHLELKAGETVRLRISSPDVMHGLSIPGLGVDIKEILPGKPVEVDVTPRAPGRYAFACIRWCSIEHWRMRGTIDVVASGAGSDGASPGAPAVTTAEPPLYQKLGINLDLRPHPVSQVIPAAGQGKPSAASGAALAGDLPANVSAGLADADSRRSISPAAAFQQMRGDTSDASLSDAEIWDLVAWAWLKDVQPATLEQAKALYSRDCAACHGPEGKGDGPAGRNLPGLRGRPENSMAQMPAEASAGVNPDEPAGPANFTDASRMLAMSDAALQGKILRGGMGTGMPEFGSLYTDKELWALVAYVRTFVLQK